MITRPRFWRVYRLVCVGLLALFGMERLAPCVEVVKTNSRHVLVLVSYHQTQIWTSRVLQNLRQELTKLPYSVDLTVIEMNSLRSRDPERMEESFWNALPEIQSGYFDLLLTLDDDAVELVTRCASQLPKDFPVVFAGFENYTPNLKEEFPWLTGVTQSFDVANTIRTGVRLYPGTQEVVILVDASLVSQNLEEQLKRSLPKIPGITITWFEEANSSVPIMLERLQDLPKNALVLVLPWRGIFGNDYRNTTAFGADLFHTLERPYLVMSETLFGFGALGGDFTIAADHAEQVAKILRQVLEKGGSQNVPVVIGKHRPIFDDQMIRDCQLDANQLPPDSLLLNCPPTFRDVYAKELRWALIGGSFLVFVIVAAIVWGRIRHQRVRRALRLFRALPGQTIVLDRQEHILFLQADEKDLPKTRSPKMLRDLEFSDEDYRRISASLMSVFQDHVSGSIDYEYQGEKWAMTIAFLGADVIGTECVIAFSHDNAELRAVRQEKKDVEKRLERVQYLWDVAINTLPMCLFIKDADDDFRYIQGNHQFAVFLGQSPEDVVGKTDSELFPEELASQIRREDEQLHQQFLNEGIASNCSQLPMADSKGNIRYSQTSRRIFRALDGTLLILGVSLDVTELELARQKAKRAQEHLEDLLLQHREILENMPASVSTLDIDHEYRYLSSNRECERMFGIPKEELIGKRLSELFSRDDPDTRGILESGLEASKHEKVSEYVLPFKNKKGESRIGRFYQRRMNLSNDRHLLFSLIVDITDQETQRQRLVQMNDQLQDLLTRYKFFVDNIPSYVLAKDIDDEFRYVSCNGALERMLQRNMSEIIGKTDYELFTKPGVADAFRTEDLAAVRERIRSELRITIQTFTGPDGRVYHTKCYRKVIVTASKRRLLFMLIVDVTELQEAKNRAEIAANRFQLTLQSIGDAVMATDQEGRITFLNHNAQKLLGITQEEGIGRPHEEVFRIISNVDLKRVV